MPYTHTSRLYFCLLFFVLFSERCCSAADRSINCMFINLEYVECTWHPNTTKMNYTFSSAFKDNLLRDCPKYIVEDNYTIGCRIPAQHHNKFDKFYAKIFTGRNHSVSEVYESLQRNVKLNPPYNLSVVWFEQNSTLVLHWKPSTPNKCIVYMVNQQTEANQYINVTETSYSPALVSQKKKYSFRVRSTPKHDCSPSDYWSNWSTWLEWGTTENINRSGWWQVLFGILPVVLLIPLVLLLCYCERIKITFLPNVPDPSKNLQDLFHKHDGNVESWVHISKELKDAFEPDYTEPSCDVCEVTLPCDVSSTAVATPTSQPDTCDRTSTEEQPAEQLSL